MTSHSIKGRSFVFIFICQGFAFTAKGQVVCRSALCSSYTSDEFTGTFREITSNPHLLPTPFPLILSTPLSLHMKSTPAFLSSLCFPVLPFIPHFAHCSFFLILFPFLLPYSCYFLHPPFPPTKALQRDHLSIKCRDM